jgi:hypothetical protein
MLHDARSIDAGLAWHGFRLPGRWLFVNNETTLSLCPLWSISNRISNHEPLCFSISWNPHKPLWLIVVERFQRRCQDNKYQPKGEPDEVPIL